MLSEQKLDDNNYLTNSDLDLENSAEIRNKIMNQSFWIGVFPDLSKYMLEYTIKQFETFIMENR
tara:strand:- start:2080 stop:2271 length:192 start_codon:yes stop_codon:yes gene_type:complete